MKGYLDRITELNSKRGKTNGIPGCLEFAVSASGPDGLDLGVTTRNDDLGTGFRKIDAWSLAVAADLESLGKRRIRSWRIDLPAVDNFPELESFARRLAYIAINNDWEVRLAVDGVMFPLAQKAGGLLSPRKDEVVRTDWGDRHDNPDRPGAVEKMLQTWLAGEERATSERLAVFGADFIYSGNQKPTKVLREVPTGSFHKQKSEAARLLPTYWADFVTLNRDGRLAVIELKISDPKLEVLAQALDYALYFRTFWDQLQGAKDLKFARKRKPGIDVYVVNNRFHARFDAAARYLHPHSRKKWGFSFKKVVLGQTQLFGGD